MRFVPRVSVRAQLTLVVLAVLLASWVLSNAATSYVVYHRMSAFRQEMLES